MELNRKINVIWYGRGDLDDECNPFNLLAHKDKILEVYRVSGGEGGSTHQNGWETYIPADDTGTFDQLECGNLYIIILHDDATLDIPEAVVSYGGTGVGENVTEVLPNDIVPSPTATETDPGDCAPSSAIEGIETSESGDTTRSVAIGSDASTTIAYILESSGIGSNVTRFLFDGCDLTNLGNQDQATLTLNMNGNATFTLENLGATGGTVYVEIVGSSAEPANGCWSADIPSDALTAPIELVKQDGNVDPQASPTQTQTPSDSATATATATPTATETGDPAPVVANEATCFAFENAEGGAYRIQWMADGTENAGTWKLSKSDAELTIVDGTDTTADELAKSFAKNFTETVEHPDSQNILNLSFCFFFNIVSGEDVIFPFDLDDTSETQQLSISLGTTGPYNTTVTSRRAWRGDACHTPDGDTNAFEF